MPVIDLTSNEESEKFFDREVQEFVSNLFSEGSESALPQSQPKSLTAIFEWPILQNKNPPKPNFIPKAGRRVPILSRYREAPKPLLDDKIFNPQPTDFTPHC